MARREPAGWSGRSSAFPAWLLSSKKSVLMPMRREGGRREVSPEEGEPWKAGGSYGEQVRWKPHEAGGSHRGQVGGIERQGGGSHRRQERSHRRQEETTVGMTH